jgi:hypothetical protein
MQMERTTRRLLLPARRALLPRPRALQPRPREQLPTSREQFPTSREELPTPRDKPPRRRQQHPTPRPEHPRRHPPHPAATPAATVHQSARSAAAKPLKSRRLSRSPHRSSPGSHRGRCRVFEAEGAPAPAQNSGAPSESPKGFTPIAGGRASPRARPPDGARLDRTLKGSSNKRTLRAAPQAAERRLPLWRAPPGGVAR